MGKESELRIKGLTSEQVEENRRKYGWNILTPPPKTPIWKLFLEKFNDPVIKILLVAWLLSMIIAGFHCWGPEAQGFTPFLEPLGIFFAILLATVVSFAFELKADKSFEVLNTVNDDTPVKVIRNGNICEIPKKEVVNEDVIVLNTGEEIPADGNLLEAVGMQVNESTLTGEPLTSKTTHEENFEKDATYPSNRVLRGTTVADGHGIMLVDKIGDATDYGKVYQGSQIDNDIDTPLQQQLNSLAKVISKAGYLIAAITFLSLTIKFLVSTPLDSIPATDIIGHLLNYFMVAVTLIVVSVPEGLPMSVTLSLALSMNRMLKTNNLVRKMHACETMGAATVICTDKTGTLTQNQMQVYATDFFGLKDQKLGNDDLSCLIMEGIAVNSTAYLDDKEGETKVLGNPTEGALLLWLHKNDQSYLSLRHGAPAISQLTFSTDRKYMATAVKSALLGKYILYVKGAPEIVLSRCQQIDLGDRKEDANAYRPTIEQQLLTYQNKAMRTLGFAYCELEDKPSEDFLTNGLPDGLSMKYLGIVAISDPVRLDVPQAVESCLKAGIDIKIVTGDTPGTAREIARQIGIWKEDDTTEHNLISGPSFAELTDEEALHKVSDIKVMNRARPSDKQRLVRLLQEKGSVVAVTGDGTNDAPALKAAQVGLSMGDGTSVAKEASDITIIDNSFGSIVRAVMWGRSLYRNIQKFLLFQLTINVAACLIVMLGSLIGTTSPLTITQMLWVNLIMDTFAAAALASLPPDERVMNDKPRRSGKDGDFIITKFMSWFIFGVGILFVIVLMGIILLFHGSDGMSPHDLSWFFTFFVMLQFWNMFNAKAFMDDRSALTRLRGSGGFLLVAALILVGQYLIVTFGGRMFSVVPLPAKDWLTIILVTSPVLIIGELVRFIIRLYHKSHEKVH